MHVSHSSAGTAGCLGPEQGHSALGAQHSALFWTTGLPSPCTNTVICCEKKEKLRENIHENHTPLFL